MKYRTLVFPDIDKLTGFIFENKVDVGIDSFHCVSGFLDEHTIAVANKKYAAITVSSCDGKEINYSNN